MSRNSVVECLTVNQDVAGSNPAETVYLCNSSQKVKSTDFSATYYEFYIMKKYRKGLKLVDSIIIKI